MFVRLLFILLLAYKFFIKKIKKELKNALAII